MSRARFSAASARRGFGVGALFGAARVDLEFLQRARLGVARSSDCLAFFSSPAPRAASALARSSDCLALLLERAAALVRSSALASFRIPSPRFVSALPPRQLLPRALPAGRPRPLALFGLERALRCSRALLRLLALELLGPCSSSCARAASRSRAPRRPCACFSSAAARASASLRLHLHILPARRQRLRALPRLGHLRLERRRPLLGLRRAPLRAPAPVAVPPRTPSAIARRARGSPP